MADGVQGKQQAERPRLCNTYREKIVPSLMSELALSNIMQVPRLEKIVVSMGLGAAVQNAKLIEMGAESLTWISGQKPVTTQARKSIATFKVRKGVSVGVMVTLRKNRMWEFLDRFINIALPRVRDFRGVDSRFDGHGNCSIGVMEQIVFPEVPYEQVERSRGLNVTLVTTAKNDKTGKALLRELGIPFRR